MFRKAILLLCVFIVLALFVMSPASVQAVVYEECDRAAWAGWNHAGLNHACFNAVMYDIIYGGGGWE